MKQGSKVCARTVSEYSSSRSKNGSSQGLHHGDNAPDATGFDFETNFGFEQLGRAKDGGSSNVAFDSSGSSRCSSPVAFRGQPARIKRTCRKTCGVGSDDGGGDGHASSSSKSSFESFGKPQRLSDINGQGWAGKASARPKKVIRLQWWWWWWWC